jgi:hypothetical protein
MRVRVIRWTDPATSAERLRVDRWCDGQWQPAKDFGLYESNEANEFAIKLSMTKREPSELAVFEDGEKLERETAAAISQYVVKEGPSENHFEGPEATCRHPMGFPCMCGALKSGKITGDQP